MTPCLRPMTEQDLSWVMEHEAQQHAFPWTRGNFSDALVAGYLAFIMELGEAATGYAVIMNVLDEAHLLNITVVGTCQGQGLGQSFLRLLSAKLKEQGVEQLFLEVRPSNRHARNLYQRFGFSLIGRRKNYYPANNGTREDALVMRLDL